jgi:purine-nucleoside phosphorylase
MTTYETFVARCREYPQLNFVVLGSGLGEIVARVSCEIELSFPQVPGMPNAGVSGHRGIFRLGHWGTHAVLLAQGRVHYYEGHPWETVVVPIQFAHSCGAKRVILTNAAGGIRDDLAPGCLMPIADVMMWAEPYPWRVEKQPSPCSASLLQRLRECDLVRPAGVYAAVSGPSYETPADVRALQKCGADAVGMSTVRELREANKLGLETVAISLITNRASGLSASTIEHTEVIEIGTKAAKRMGEAMERLLL